VQGEWKKHHLLLPFFVEELQVRPERARMTQALLEAEVGAPFRAQSTILVLSVQEWQVVDGRCEPVKLEPPPTALMSPVVGAAKIVSVGVLQEQDVVEDSAVEGVQVAVEESPETGTAPMEYLVRRLTDEVANETVHSEHSVAVVWLS
jgi:hypothetical protein